MLHNLVMNVKLVLILSPRSFSVTPDPSVNRTQQRVTNIEFVPLKKFNNTYRLNVATFKNLEATQTVLFVS